MKTCKLALPLAVVLLSGALVAADSIRDARVLKARMQSRLEQTAQFIKRSSGGKSRLMTERASSAVPSGYAVRLPGWGDLPLVTVCPVSHLYKTKLRSLGQGTAMASVTVLEHGGGNTPDVYLLFSQDPKPERKGRSYLVAVTPKPVGQPLVAIRTELMRSSERFSTVGRLPIANASFSGTDVEIRLRWDAETYTYIFTPELEFVWAYRPVS